MSNIDETFAAKDKKTSPWKISCLIVFINLFLIQFFLWGVDEAYVAWQLQTHGITASGTVVQLEEVTDSDGTGYRPLIEFKVNDQTYIFKGIYASNPPRYNVGDQVNIRYDPANPGVAQIDSYFERWLIPAMILPGAILIALVANVTLLRKWRSAKATSDQL